MLKIAGKTFSSDLRKQCLITGKSLSPPTKIHLVHEKITYYMDDYDLIVSAEISDPDTHPQLHAIVTKFMMHGPSSTANPKAHCMVDGHCSKRFLKDYVKDTNAGSDGYPHYRRDTGKCVNKSGVLLDNKYIVPYNQYLSKR